MMKENGGDGTGNYVVITFDFYWLIKNVKLFSFLVRRANAEEGKVQLLQGDKPFFREVLSSKPDNLFF